MKLTRSAFVSVFIVLVLVAAIVLGFLYKSANDSHKLAQSNLNAERLSLTALNKQKTDLAGQIAQATADVAAWNGKITLLQTALGQAGLSLKLTQSKFPASAQTIEYNETLMGLARSSNLTMQLLVAAEPTSGQLGSAGFKFYINVFTIDVSGKVSDILDFVDKVVTNGIFKTGTLTPVKLDIPQPLSQAVKDQMRADIRAELVAQANANLTAVQRVVIIEKAILSLLEEPSAGPTVAEMTQKIKDIITVEFGANIANSLALDIALAIEQNEADNLIRIVADIYGNYIGQLIAEGRSDLIINFLGKFGEDITDALGEQVSSALPGQVVEIITKKLQALVAKQIEALVTDDSVNSRLATAVTVAEMPAAQLTVTVYSYKGD